MSGWSTRGRFVRECLIGLTGGLIGGLAMNAYARAVSGATGGRESDGAPGGDLVGRGMQPPQGTWAGKRGCGWPLGFDRVSRADRSPANPELKPALGSAAHYAFSAAAGVSYALMAERVPSIRICFGALCGTVVWAVADEGITPALGLSRGPRRLPLGLHIYSLVGTGCMA